MRSRNNSEVALQGAAWARGRCRGGFSLMELLVVVAMISIILALTFPALRQARETTWSTNCQSNLHQIHTALGLYRTEYMNQTAKSLPSAYGWVSFVGLMRSGHVLKCPKKQKTDGDALGDPFGDNIDFLPTPPPSVKFNDLEHPTLIRAFRERENFILPADVNVNFTEPGLYCQAGDYQGGVIPAGSAVDCFFLHYEGPGSQNCTTSGEFHVWGNILGVVCDDQELDESDAILGLPEVMYDTGRSARGYEEGTEIVTLTADARTLEINHYHVTFPGEDARVITEPGTSASYGMNNLIPEQWPRATQLLLTEYKKSVIDIDFKDGNNDDLEEMIEPRHFDKANTMLGDGSIVSADPESAGLYDPLHEIWQP